MARASAIATNFANRPPHKAGSIIPQGGETNWSDLDGVNGRIINAVKEMYAYPAVILGRWLRISDKGAKRKLAGERGLSAEEIAVLIRSERGFEIVTAIMGNAKPAWWRICAVLMDTADIRKAEMAAKRRAAKVLQEVLDDDRQLAEQIQRAETLAFLGQDQAGIHADAMRSMARPQGRAVASRAKR